MSIVPSYDPGLRIVTFRNKADFDINLEKTI